MWEVGVVTAKKLQDELAYPPRAMRAERAAAYLGMSSAAFLRLVDAETMPQPVRVGGITMWDRLDLDAAFENLKDHGAQNTVHRILRERRNAKATAPAEKTAGDQRPPSRSHQSEDR
jgi:predicted DNA-binding transcriptional regulator AlpA